MFYNYISYADFYYQVSDVINLGKKVKPSARKSWYENISAFFSVLWMKLKGLEGQVKKSWAKIFQHYISVFFEQI